jgi:hypothetical protein
LTVSMQLSSDCRYDSYGIRRVPVHNLKVAPFPPITATKSNIGLCENKGVSRKTRVVAEHRAERPLNKYKGLREQMRRREEKGPKLRRSSEIA